MNTRGLGWAVGLPLVALLLQSTWLNGARLGGELPDLATATALVLALVGGWEVGLAAGLSAGLLLGWGVGLALPAFVASRAGGALVVATLRGRWQQDHLLVALGAVLWGTLATELLFVVGYPAVLLVPHLLRRIVWRALLSAAVAPILAAVALRLPEVREAARRD